MPYHKLKKLSMPITLKSKMKELSPVRRKKVEARVAELIAEEMSLREPGGVRKPQTSRQRP